MAQIREIKKRMGAVKTIQRITKTMQMIATAKFTASLQRTKATQPYTEKVRQLVGDVAAAAGEVEHPLIDGPKTPTGRELLLVITSDRGMCGAYNGNVLRNGMKQLREVGQANCDLEIAGKKAVGFFEFQGVTITEKHLIGDNPQYDACEKIAQRFIDLFTEGKYDAIRVAYMKFESNSRQTPVVMQLLPLKPEVSDDDGAEYDFSPSSELLLEDLLPRSVKTSLFQAFNDAAVSEHIMRMIAMKSATENASDIGRSLKQQFNRARQAIITTELMEIIAGAAALE